MIDKFMSNADVILENINEDSEYVQEAADKKVNILNTAMEVVHASPEYKAKIAKMTDTAKAAFDSAIEANIKTTMKKRKISSNSAWTAIFVILALLDPVLIINIAWAAHFLSSKDSSFKLDGLQKQLVTNMTRMKDKIAGLVESEALNEETKHSDTYYIQTALDKIHGLKEYQNKIRGMSKKQVRELDSKMTAAMQNGLPKAKAIARKAAPSFGKILLMLLGIAGLNLLIVVFVLITLGLGIIGVYAAGIYSAFYLADLVSDGEASAKLKKLATSLKINEATSVNGKTTPNDMVDLLNKRNKKAKKMTHFKESVNNYLIESALNTIFDEVMNESTSEDYELAIGHNILKRYVEETGYNNIKRRFYNKNLTLSEIARHVDMVEEEIMNEMSKNCENNDSPDDDVFTMDKEIADKFTSKIQKLIPDTTIKAIQTRTADAIQSFINQNIDKEESIKDVYLRANSKITKLTPEEKAAGFDEDYREFAKRDVNKIYNRDSSVLEAMYRIMSSNIHQNQALMEQFSDGNGNMDVKKIINDSAVVYTVLEMMNTMEMVDVNSEYIHSVLEDLKAN